MIPLLYRHIIKEWLRFFVGAFVVLVLLLTVANLISGFLRSNVSVLEVIINHLIELPGYSSQIFPVACLMASLFSVNKLKSRNELTAIFASGFSRQDFIAALIIISAFAGAMQFAFSSYLHPYTKSHRHQWITDGHKKFGNLKSKGLMTSTISSGKLWYRTKDFFLAFSAFNKKNNTLQNVSLYYIGEGQLLAKKLNARTATYQGDGAWSFSHGTINTQLDAKAFPTLQNFNQLKIDLSMDLEQFLQAEADITTLNIHQLREYIQHLDDSGINTSEYQVMYLDKFSSTLICIIFALMAGVGIFNPNRRSSNFGKNVVFVFAFTLIYWFVYSYVSELGRSSKIEPLIACFAVPALFMGYLSLIFYKNRHLSA